MNKGIIAYIDTTEMIPAGGGYDLPGVNLYVKCCCSSEIVIKITMNGNSIYIPCSMVITPSVSVYLNGSFKFENTAYTIKALVSYYEPEHFTYTVTLDDSSSDLIARINEVDLKTNARIDTANNRIIALENVDTQRSPADSNPLMDGTANSGSALTYSRSDHRHPSDSTKANLTDVQAIQSQLQDSAIYHSASGSIISLRNVYGGIEYKTLALTVPIAQEGSGEPSSTNKRDIIGYSEIKVMNATVNLIDPSPFLADFTIAGVTFKSLYPGYYVLNGTSTATSWIPFLPGTGTEGPSMLQVNLPRGNYVVSANNTGVNTYAYHNGVEVAAGANTIRVTNSPIDYIRYLFPANKTYTNSPFFIQVTLNETTVYNRFNGNGATITMPQELGTLYGGDVDLNAGVITSKYVRLTPDFSRFAISDASYSRYRYRFINSGGVVPSIDHRTASRGNFFCNMASVAQYSELSNNDLEGAGVDGPPYASGNFFVDVFLHEQLTAEQFANKYSDIYFIFPIYSPEHYNVSIDKIITLEGTNTLFVNNGTLLVDYRIR